jgi:hypothetical protein
MPPTSSSALRKEWSPSTKVRVAGPGMADVTTPRHEEARQAQLGKVLRAQSVRTSRRVQRVADEHERGGHQPVGHGQGTHAPAEGTPTGGDAAHVDAESVRQGRTGGPHRVDADGGRVRAALAGGLAGELHPLDDDADLGHGAVDGHQPGLLASRTGTRGEHQAGRSRWRHAAILVDG